MSEEQNIPPDLCEAIRNLAEAITKTVVEPVLIAINEIWDAISPAARERRCRRMKMKQLRADFIRKRGMRR